MRQQFRLIAFKMSSLTFPVLFLCDDKTCKRWKYTNIIISLVQMQSVHLLLLICTTAKTILITLTHWEMQKGKYFRQHVISYFLFIHLVFRIIVAMKRKWEQRWYKQHENKNYMVWCSKSFICSTISWANYYDANPFIFCMRETDIFSLTLRSHNMYI